jgi:hypothetical protein
MSDIMMVEPDDETSFADLPGVDGFDQLGPELQLVVLSRANRARCDCGCIGHSVNACLHQDEACDVARSIAAGFVTDASILALVVPEGGAAREAADATDGQAAPMLGPSEAVDESGSGASGTPAVSDAIPALPVGSAGMLPTGPVAPAPAEGSGPSASAGSGPSAPAGAGTSGPFSSGASGPEP